MSEPGREGERPAIDGIDDMGMFCPLAERTNVPALGFRPCVSGEPLPGREDASTRILDAGGDMEVLGVGKLMGCCLLLPADPLGPGAVSPLGV